jgi:hypothetical protein
LCFVGIPHLDLAWRMLHGLKKANAGHHDLFGKKVESFGTVSIRFGGIGPLLHAYVGFDVLVSITRQANLLRPCLDPEFGF